MIGWPINNGLLRVRKEAVQAWFEVLPEKLGYWHWINVMVPAFETLPCPLGYSPVIWQILPAFEIGYSPGIWGTLPAFEALCRYLRHSPDIWGTLPAFEALSWNLRYWPTLETLSCDFRHFTGGIWGTVAAFGALSWNCRQFAVDTVLFAPDDGWKYHTKHVEHFPDINKLCNVAHFWICIGILLGAHPFFHTSRIMVNIHARDCLRSH
jgi:hypothetical protein